MFPVITVEGVPAKVFTGGGLGGTWTGMGDDASLISSLGRGSMDPWCAISALRAATIG
jgi:hypothetical protein